MRWPHRDVLATVVGDEAELDVPVGATLRPFFCRQSLLVGCLSGILLAGIAGCGKSASNRSDLFASPHAVTREASKGPVKVQLQASSTDLGLSDTLHVRLRAVADPSVTVSDIPYESALSDGDRAFEYHAKLVGEESAKPLSDGRLQWTLDFDVEFFLPGDFKLPPAEVTFVDASAASQDSGKKQGDTPSPSTVQTTDIALMVRAPADVNSKAGDLASIKRLDPVELPEEVSYGKWIVAVAVVIVLSVIAAFLWRRSRRRTTQAVVIPAHIWARRELDDLARADLISRGRVQDFYYRISGVVRGYIERRFAVSAPEMTTEEFLTAASADRRFGPRMTGELDKFLVACDLVKYARQEPGRTESDAVFDAASDFVEQTREDAAPDATQEERAA